MWEANPHGGGFAVMTTDKVYVSKGFMNPEDMWVELEKYQEHHLVVHYRLATHGTKTPDMTHPFMITKHLDESTALLYETKKGVLFHNGVLGHFGNNSVSDTAQFVTRVLAAMDDPNMMVRLLHQVGSKYVLIHPGPNGQILYWLVGTFADHEGMRVSNTNFDRRAWTPSKKWKGSIPSTRAAIDLLDYDGGDSTSSSTLLEPIEDECCKTVPVSEIIKGEG